MATTATKIRRQRLLLHDVDWHEYSRMLRFFAERPEWQRQPALTVLAGEEFLQQQRLRRQRVGCIRFEQGRQFIAERCAELEETLAALHYPLATCVVHGDAHLGILVPSPAGPVLCDFDSTCLGPPEWDLVSTAVSRVTTGWLQASQRGDGLRHCGPPGRCGRCRLGGATGGTTW